MSRLNKANEIIELAILMQNSYCGLTTDDIAKHFECCRRSAERMKAVLYEKFGNKIEEVTNLTDKKNVGDLKKVQLTGLSIFQVRILPTLNIAQICLNLRQNKKKSKNLLKK